jgi:hypothetical protein
VAELVTVDLEVHERMVVRPGMLCQRH